MLERPGCGRSGCSHVSVSLVTSASPDASFASVGNAPASVIGSSLFRVSPLANKFRPLRLRSELRALPRLPAVTFAALARGTFTYCPCFLDRSICHVAATATMKKIHRAMSQHATDLARVTDDLSLCLLFIYFFSLHLGKKIRLLKQLHIRTNQGAGT